MLSQRIARLNQAEGQHSVSGFAQQGPLQMADECLTRSLLGLQNYNQQSPQIKQRLLLFAREIEKLQAAEREALLAGQATLDQSFAAQRAAQATAILVEPLDAESFLLAAAVQKKRIVELGAVAQPSTAETHVSPPGPMLAPP